MYPYTRKLTILVHLRVLDEYISYMYEYVHVRVSYEYVQINILEQINFGSQYYLIVAV